VPPTPSFHVHHLTTCCEGRLEKPIKTASLVEHNLRNEGRIRLKAHFAGTHGAGKLKDVDQQHRSNAFALFSRRDGEILDQKK